MTEQKAEIYVPALPVPEQLKSVHELLREARERDFRTGLMLVLLGPQNLSQENIKETLGNLDPFVGLSKAERPGVFIMHPFQPLTGPGKFNLLTNPQESQEYVEQTVELAAMLPEELKPETGGAISFHLNTLAIPEGKPKDEDYWTRAFEDVLKRVRAISEFGQRKGVSVAVETMPIPEFGDRPKSPKTLFDDGKSYWCHLADPWPLLFWRPEVKKLREAGSNIATDICHSFIALRAMIGLSKMRQEKREKFATKYLISAEDIKTAPNITFTQAVLENTQSQDIWHLSDARGLYRQKDIHGKESHFEEGVALFEGDIPQDQLKLLIQQGLRRRIKFVLEIIEKDYVGRPATKESLKKVLAEG